MNGRMIFYHSSKIPEIIDSGSKVHLWKMIKAFRSNDYGVDIVSGYPRQRRAKINCLVEQQNKGVVYDFVFSESPSLPSLLNRRNIFFPFLDMKFFKWCQKTSIPIGLFYGDIHWKFPHYKRTVSLLRRIISTALYQYDWHLYTKYINHLFLPSLEMNKYLPEPWPLEKVSELLPGCDFKEKQEESQVLDSLDNYLHIIYVGGVTPPLYDLSPLFELAGKIDGLRITLCCRNEEWNVSKFYYEPFNQRIINIEHCSGEQLSEYYQQADLFGLLWKPNSYLNFAMPVKLFEAIGYCKPIISLEGTAVSKFIKESNIGWVLPSIPKMIELIKEIKENPEILRSKVKKIKEKRQDHLWISRGKKVIEVMSKYSSR